MAQGRRRGLRHDGRLVTGTGDNACCGSGSATARRCARSAATCGCCASHPTAGSTMGVLAGQALYRGVVAMTGRWQDSTPGLLALPSGRRLRGRGLRRPLSGGPAPEFGLYLLGAAPDPVAWPARWLRWPDFRLPTDRDDAVAAFTEAWERAADERVEVACGGGRGRTGTALACIAVLDGVPAEQAVDYVRKHYDPRAVETSWQRRYVERFRPRPPQG